jgi:hypothetical protein
MTVGGGFTGFTAASQLLFQSDDRSASMIILFTITLSLNAFVIASGLLFMQRPQSTGPMFLAIALQVPWVSCSSFAHRFACGFETLLGIAYPQEGGSLTLKFSYHFGSGCTFTIGKAPFILGINIWALAMLTLLGRSVQSPVVVLPPHEPQRTTSTENAVTLSH